MIKTTVLYGHPDDPVAFERHYDDVHIPLVNAMPNLRRFDMALAGPPTAVRPRTTAWPSSTRPAA